MCPSWVTIAKRHIGHLSCWGWAGTKGRWTDRRGCRISVKQHLPLITEKAEMTGTFSGRIVSLPTFYLGSPFEIPLRNKSNAKPPPSTRREATLGTQLCEEWSLYLPRIWDHDQTSRSYWHCCLISAFSLCNPQEFFALLVPRLCWYWVYIKMVIYGLRKPLPVDVAPSGIYASRPGASGRGPAC